MPVTDCMTHCLAGAAGLQKYLAFVSYVQVLSNLRVAAAALQCLVLIMLFSCLLRLW